MCAASSGSNVSSGSSAACVNLAVICAQRDFTLDHHGVSARPIPVADPNEPRGIDLSTLSTRWLVQFCTRAALAPSRRRDSAVFGPVSAREDAGVLCIGVSQGE